MKAKEERRQRRGRPFKITSTGKLIDDALEAVEMENLNGAERHRRPSNVARRVRARARINRTNVLHKNYTQLQIDPASGAGLIDLIATIATIPFKESGGLAHFSKTTCAGHLTNAASEAAKKETSRNGDLRIATFKERRQLSQTAYLT